MQKIPKLRWALSASMIATLAACANYSGIDPVAKPIDATPLGLDNKAAPLPDTDWWLALNDAQLNALIQQAVANSPNLRASQARLALAQAQTAQRKAADGPQVGLEGSLQRQLFSANTIYPPPYGGTEYDMGTLQAGASWELDFFGKNSAALAAALGQSRAAEADLKAARGLLAVKVARSYYQVARIEAQSRLVQRTLAVREALKGLVGDRLKAGLDTQLELEQSQGALPDVQLQLEQLSEQKELTLNALAALTAQPRAALQLQLSSVPDLTQIALPAQPQALPLNLLGARSDIAAARWRIEAAQKDVQAAKASFYPNIDLTAYLGFSSIGFDKLLTSKSSQWGVGPAINLPLFDSGRLRAQLGSKTADLDAAVESYNTQVLEAVHEVSDQLATAQSVQRQQAQQRVATQSAEHGLQIAQSRLKAGLATQLVALQAELPVLVQQRNATELAARALDNRVQLLHAVGAALP